MMKRYVLILLGLAVACSMAGQSPTIEERTLPQGHPRYLTEAGSKKDVLRLTEEEPWAKDVLVKLKERTDKYASLGAEWLTSRLQMYWQSHATEVYVRGEYYDHAGGEPAPAPTVMYTGARSHATNYIRPKLEELTPYQEDARGMYLANKTIEGNPKEWVSISKTGNIIQSINVEILGIARDAAFLWWLTGEEKYAALAVSVFDTYMTGIYWRNLPKGIEHGHQMTIIGMTTFEVIHEDALTALVPMYDFLYDRLMSEKPEKMDIYAEAFKKWAENIIDNGVPHNNWNSIQANFILSIGIILEDNALYADGKGRGYYIDYVLNRSSIRQWSLKRLADYGYDKDTGIWAECAGYSQVVANDYTNLVTTFDRNFGIDLTEEIPVITKAIEANPQCLFPDMMTIGFGDTHPSPLSPDLFRRLVRNARKHGKTEEEKKFTAMLKLFDKPAQEKAGTKVAVTSLLDDAPLELDESVRAGEIDDYVTPTFYAPNAGWLVQRNGMNKSGSLMIAQNASLGNHNHANGISMELYGKGFRLAPDAGIGTSLYSGLDYAEWYSQFPAHNTVCVDGISSYPIMKCNHPFCLIQCYPAPGAKVSYPPVSYSEVYFLEPETQSDQSRTMSIVTLDETAGYYVDVFRSRKQAEGDKTHDYFYHNMGQKMALTAADGTPLELQPTEELAFAGGHLYAYSYIHDKLSTETATDIKATFTIEMPDSDNVTMTMWMKGEAERTVFSALSPMTEGLSRLKDMPYDIKSQPTLTYIARQRGEAWERPFTAVFEPSAASEPGRIEQVTFPEVKSADGGSHVAIRVNLKDGSEDIILSSDDACAECNTGELRTKAVYALWRSEQGESRLLFLGGGTLMVTPDATIEAEEAADIMLKRSGNKWQYTATKPCRITVGNKTYNISTSDKFSDLHR